MSPPERRRSVTVVVAGVPVPQGSMKAFTVAGRARVTHSNGGKIDIWRRSIVDAVHRQLGEEIDLMTGPVRLSAAFRLPRPASIPKTRRTWPIGARSGDADKLLRCLGDAVTGVLIDDDSRIVDARVTKDYANPGAQPGVVFTLEEVGDNA
jgi:crossover junction endodeoxyribonuclease RusA